MGFPPGGLTDSAHDFALGVRLAQSAFPVTQFFSAVTVHYPPVRKRRERVAAAIKGAV